MFKLFVGAFLCLTMLLATSLGAQNVFQQCLKNQPNLGVMGCAGRQALYSLNTIQESDNFTIDNGFTMVRVDSLASRKLPSFLDQDPLDFRLVKN